MDIPSSIHKNTSTTDYNFYAELRRSIDTKDFKQKILDIVKHLGFSDYIVAPLERDWQYESQQGFLSSYPDEFWVTYQEEELYKHDALISFVKENIHPFFNSQIYDYFCNAPFDNEVTRINRAIRQLHHSFGFFEQHTSPILSNDNNDKYLLTLSQQNMDPTTFQAKANNVIPQIHALGLAIIKVCHLKFPTLFKRPAKKVVYIAPKPLLVLTTLANEDLTITGVADKLCISPITAHQHIAAARKALKKQTNIGAIKKAMKLGLISYNS